MNPVKVSVIMPVYNTAEYVKDALACITYQSLSDIEVIVIDDGSTDNSYQAMLSMADQDDRIRIIRQENKGQSEARNLGISLATGEYLYFMDSDDLLDKEAFSACYAASAGDNLDLLFFDAEVFGTVKNTLNLTYRRTHLIKEGIYSGADILEALLKNGGYRASPCLLFTRSSYLKKINLTFHPGIIHEDELFTFYLFINAGRVSFINKPYFKRRLRDNSTMSTGFSRKNLHGYFTVANELIKFKYNLADKQLKSLVDLRLRDMMHSLIYNSRFLKIKDRYYVLGYLLFQYPQYFSIKNTIMLIFPWLQWLRERK